MHSNDAVTVPSKPSLIFCHGPTFLTDFKGMTRERHFVQHPDAHVPSTTEGPKTDVQLQHLPPKSGLKRMSYPFSNLSTVVLATDIPVLPVEELRAESTSVTAILSSTTEYFVVLIDFVSLQRTRCTIQDQGTFPVLSTSMT